MTASVTVAGSEDASAATAYRVLDRYLRVLTL